MHISINTYAGHNIALRSGGEISSSIGLAEGSRLVFSMTQEMPPVYIASEDDVGQGVEILWNPVTVALPTPFMQEAFKSNNGVYVYDATINGLGAQKILEEGVALCRRADLSNADAFFVPMHYLKDSGGDIPCWMVTASGSFITSSIHKSDVIINNVIPSGSHAEADGIIVIPIQAYVIDGSLFGGVAVFYESSEQAPTTTGHMKFFLASNKSPDSGVAKGDIYTDATIFRPETPVVPRSYDMDLTVKVEVATKELDSKVADAVAAVDDLMEKVSDLSRIIGNLRSQYVCR